MSSIHLVLQITQQMLVIQTGMQDPIRWFLQPSPFREAALQAGL